MVDTVEVTVTGDAVFVMLSGSVTADGVAVAVAVLLRSISAKTNPFCVVLHCGGFDADEAAAKGICGRTGMQASDHITDNGTNIDA